jgi:N6-adenosine-specific RNA methylase IME4
VKRDRAEGSSSGEAATSASAAAAAAALGSAGAVAAAEKLSSGSAATASPALYPAEGVGSDIIFSERRGQSQKPEEIYQLVEAVCPGGSYLEIFGRKNNLRDFWVTVGNEVTGTGPPREDATVIAAGGRIPGAVYGAAGR